MEKRLRLLSSHAAHMEILPEHLRVKGACGFFGGVGWGGGRGFDWTSPLTLPPSGEMWRRENDDEKITRCLLL